MKKLIIVTAIAFGACATAFAAGQGKGKSGEALFKEHCTLCHPDGGNIVTPDKTLHKKDMNANKINKPEDVIKLMRNPGPGMTMFDQKTISDADAKKIAEYILKAFK